MAEISDTTTYPNTTPVLGDHFIGTDVSNTTNDANGEVVTFSFQAAMDLFEANFAAPASAISSGTFADARIAASNVTQHQAALSLTESQISDLGTYSTATGVENNADVTDEANVTAALDGATLTDLGTPASGDLILLQDASDSSNLKVAQFSTFGGAGAGDAWGDAVDANIVPDADGTRNIGADATRFATGYFDDIEVTNGTSASGVATSAIAAGDEIFAQTSAHSFKLIAVADLENEVTLAGTETLTNKTLTDPKITLTVNAQTGTTYTLVLADAHKKVTMSNASANTLTIPTNASVAFATGTILGVSMIGAGTTTVTGDTGVTVNGVSAGGAAISAQYTGVTLTKIGTNTWLMEGNHGTVA